MTTYSNAAGFWAVISSASNSHAASSRRRADRRLSGARWGVVDIADVAVEYVEDAVPGSRRRCPGCRWRREIPNQRDDRLAPVVFLVASFLAVAVFLAPVLFLVPSFLAVAVFFGAAFFFATRSRLTAGGA